MKISNFFNNTFVLSFEVFPPMREGNLSNLFATVRELIALHPHFISVTYGAGGTTQEMTFEIASRMKNDVWVEVLTHLTCVHATRDDIAKILDELNEENIRNILALRGDPPQSEQRFVKTEGGFGYANELVEFIKTYGDFSIGVAGYPEGHIEAPDRDTDVEHLKRKVDAGADFIITQLFFNNDDFYRFRDRAMTRGISIPIIPGIFPIFNFKQIAKIASLCGAAIPDSLSDTLQRVSNNSDDIRKYGTEYALRQSQDLLENDIPGLHFYSMNKSSHIAHIIKELKLNKEESDESAKRISGGPV